MVGLSMGGTLAAGWPSTIAEIGGLALVNPFVDPPAPRVSRGDRAGLLDQGTEVLDGHRVRHRQGRLRRARLPGDAPRRAPLALRRHRRGRRRPRPRSPARSSCSRAGRTTSCRRRRATCSCRGRRRPDRAGVARAQLPRGHPRLRRAARSRSGWSPSRPGARRTRGCRRLMAEPDRITREDVAYVARLARLELTDEELDLYTGQLAAVLDHAAEVAALDTGRGRAATAHPLPLHNVLRPDEPRPSSTATRCSARPRPSRTAASGCPASSGRRRELDDGPPPSWPSAVRTGGRRAAGRARASTSPPSTPATARSTPSYLVIADEARAQAAAVDAAGRRRARTRARSPACRSR